jgi:hypothetical protein
MGGIAAIYLFTRPSKNKVIPFVDTSIAIDPIRNDTIFQDDTLEITWKHLPENDDAVQVRFNDDVTGPILKHNRSAIRVLVPRLSAAHALVRVNVNGIVYTASRYVPYVQKEVIMTNANSYSS